MEYVPPDVPYSDDFPDSELLHDTLDDILLKMLKDLIQITNLEGCAELQLQYNIGIVDTQLVLRVFVQKPTLVTDGLLHKREDRRIEERALRVQYPIDDST